MLTDSSAGETATSRPGDWGSIDLTPAGDNDPDPAREVTDLGYAGGLVLLTLLGDIHPDSSGPFLLHHLVFPTTPYSTEGELLGLIQTFQSSDFEESS